MEDREIRAALDRHWTTSDGNDFEDLPGRRCARISAIGRAQLQAAEDSSRIVLRSRTGKASTRGVSSVRRSGPLNLTCYGRPTYTVSIMEFLSGMVARETQYFGDPFERGPSRVQWVERMA